MITFDYSGKVALITGGARGLGFAIAKAFLDVGAIVILNDRTASAVEQAMNRLGGKRIVPAPADLALPDGPKAAVAPAIAHGRLDFLINNAAINIERPIEDTDDDHWDRHLAVVLKATFFTTKQALDLLVRSQGSIINIASELGLHAIPNNVAYVTAKHGVIAMTKAMAIELASRNIRVNVICPGTMDTELMRECARDSGDPDAYYKSFRDFHPLGRLASPEEIAQFVLCLASPAAAYITGSAVAIDGGSTAGRRS